MMFVRVRRLPATSALSLHFSGGKSAWDLQAHLLADLVGALVGREYPDRPGASGKTDQTAEQRARRERRREGALARARAHNHKPKPKPDIAAAIEQAKANARAEKRGGGTK